MIYFVQSVDGGPIKIGATWNLSARLAEHEATYGMKLRVLGVTGGWLKEEKDFHRRFSRLRVGGEWFADDAELTGFIAEAATPWDGTDERPRRVAKQDVILQYKADRSVSIEFKEWLAGLADHVGVPVTNTLDIALKRLGESENMRPMPRRLVR